MCGSETKKKIGLNDVGPSQLNSISLCGLIERMSVTWFVLCGLCICFVLEWEEERKKRAERRE